MHLTHHRARTLRTSAPKALLPAPWLLPAERPNATLQAIDYFLSMTRAARPTGLMLAAGAAELAEAENRKTKALAIKEEPPRADALVALAPA